MPDANGRIIDKLDFPNRHNSSRENARGSPDARTPLLHDSESIDSDRRLSANSGHFFEHVAEGIQERDRAKLKVEVIRYTSFVWAILSCLCAGSLTAYSLYAPLFQSRLHYTQYQVNLVSISAEVALYLPVPIVGFACDRYGPRLPSLLAAILFGGSYLVAAFAYRSGPLPGTPGEGNHGWPVAVMVLAFVGIGVATSGMYLAAVTTCAKNFGRGKHKGFALSAPIAAFGLSGMWQSQVGSRLLYERNPDGSRGDVDVFRYFLFLAILLAAVGLVGTVLLQIVGEEELIDEAVDELERSGLLEDSEFFRPHDENHYGTIYSSEDTRRLSRDEIEERKRQKEEEARKKAWLLNSETRRFLSDHTLWWLAAGFFLVSGPGDAFINNLGTIIGTLYPPPSDTATGPELPRTTPATQVSIIALTSTLARILSGALSDLLAPPSTPHNHRRAPASLASSLASLDPIPHTTSSLPPQRFTLSRMPLLLFSLLLLSVGLALLASGVIQNHASPYFGLVTACVGTGYGATFALVPIIISCVWGVENFGTNWGIVAVVPAAGAAFWGVIYAANYSAGTDAGGVGDGRCYGAWCYQQTFWGMAAAVWVACGLWVWAWKGPGGWTKRGVMV